jgi:hypothetical protein
MQTPHPYLFLIIVIILVLSVSCAPRATSNLSTIIKTDSSSTPLPSLPSTRSPGSASASQPIPAPKSTRTPHSPAGNEGNEATQNMVFDVPAHPIDVILGRPTGNSITVSVLAYQDVEIYVEYGHSPDDFSNQTPPRTLGTNQSVDILVNGLQANTGYTYRVRYRSGEDGDFAATDPGTFFTQRAVGSPFIFTIQADSHLDSNSNPQVYLQNLANQRADQPDFVIDLGDTFMTDKYKPYTAALPQYLAQRYYFSLIGQSVPLFLVLGNHDGEGAPRSPTNEMSTWSVKLRTQLFPNPAPDTFYTGNTTPDTIVGFLQDYYAWEWGDALFIVLDPYWFTPPQLGATNSLWDPTLGNAQYQWLKTTLETSRAKWKFVFIHQLIGGADKNGRGGVEVANFYEWGGNNADGSYGFDAQRPGWGLPIHQLLITNNVTAVFHGHDHLFVKQELDGIIYQEVPQPGASRSNVTNSASEYGYRSGDILGSSGYLRVTVAPDQVTIEYIRTYLPQDEIFGQQNGQIDYIYTILPQ